MKKLLCIIGLLVLVGAGCGNMSNEEMLEKKELCKQLGLDAKYIPEDSDNYEKVVCEGYQVPWMCMPNGECY